MHRILQCPACGKTFETYTSHTKYCSDECRLKDRWLKHRADILERQKVYRMTGKYPRKKINAD